MKCGLLNIRSIRNKLCFIAETLTEHNLDILCLTETWLLSSDVAVVGAALPPSYSFHHVPRPMGVRGGGVGLVHSRALGNVRVVPNHMDVSSFEVLEITYSLHSQKIRMVVVYRPGHPGTDSVFIEEFGRYLEYLSGCQERLLVCGDFNYWLDSPSLKPYTGDFLSLLDMNNLFNHVQKPTHISGHILDLLITSVDTDLLNCVELSPIDGRISDHALITFELDIMGPATYSRTIRFQNYRRLNEREAVSFIEGHLLSEVAEGVTAERRVDSYNRGFSLLRDRLCPIVTKEIRVRDNAEWYDYRVAALRRERRRAERRWRETGTEAARASFVSARRAVVKQIHNCKVEYYQNQLSRCDGDHKRTFMFLNNLLGRTSNPEMPTSSSSSDLASRFSAFFSDKITRIRGEIGVVAVDSEFSLTFPLHFTRSSSLSHFRPVTEADVLKYIRASRRTCCSLDPIDVSKLGGVFELAAPALAAIMNSSFEEGHFVASEKRGLIRPHLKKSGLDKDNLSNYRPVTNLSYLSKIMERAILDQLVSFLDEAGVVPRYQSAYREFHSTETALCRIYDDLVANTCRGKPSILALLDLSAAFDTVDHQLLLGDLSDCGIEGTALSLLRSYLENREQSVIVGESCSEPITFQCGVPQGSVLGPTLFTVYMGTLIFLLEAHGVSYHFYADDTQLYIVVDDIGEAKNRLLSLLSDLKIWMARRKLKLNDGKTEILVITGNLRNVSVADFGTMNFDGTRLVPCESARSLGVILDSSLTFRSHIDSIVRTCNYCIRNLYMIRDFISRKNLISLVHSLVVSKVDYCNSLLIGLPNVTLKRVQSILNRAARLIFNLHPMVPTTSSLIQLHWLPLKARIEFKVCLITFKALKFNKPLYVRELLSPAFRESAAGLRSADDPHRLHEPRAIGEKRFADRSFSYVAPRLYNRLPLTLRTIDSLDAFKRQLKAFLFSRAYDLTRLAVNND